MGVLTEPGKRDRTEIATKATGNLTVDHVPQDEMREGGERQAKETPTATVVAQKQRRFRRLFPTSLRSSQFLENLCQADSLPDDEIRKGVDDVRLQHCQNLPSPLRGLARATGYPWQLGGKEIADGFVSQGRLTSFEADAIYGGEPHLLKNLNGYRIERVIGTGGMGRVYKAMMKGEPGRYALKAIHPSILDQANSQLAGAQETYSSRIRRLEEEFRVLEDLNHPHIVKVFRLEQLQGTPVIVMEYIDGKNIGELVSSPTPPNHRTVLGVILQTARALAYAHQGEPGKREPVLHRDIKPSNILVTFNDHGEPHAKLTDFGVARIVQEDLEGTRLTQTGDLMGSPRYFSPEVVRRGSKHVGPASDQYSLGITAFELLGGRLEYTDQAKAGEVIEAIKRRESLSRTHDPEGKVPEELMNIISRTTMKNPQDRFPSMDQVVKGLKTFLRDHSS